jgi:N-acetylmuramoyl-L-alanine amidase
MRKINLIVLHCSATKDTQTYTPEQLERDHKARGFIQAGYHFYVRRNGEIVSMRPVEQIPAHAKGFNRNSIAICYEGGLDVTGKPKDTRTIKQKESIRILLLLLLTHYPGARICGHRDLGAHKACPCFNAEEEYADL